MRFLPFRAPKQFLLCTTLLTALALTACGGHDSSSTAANSGGGQNPNDCKPTAANEALSDAVKAQCDQGNPNPPVYEPNLPSPPPTPGTRECTTDHFTQDGSGNGKKLDVLFVMDTRFGWRWKKVAEQLHHFTDHLSGVDLRISVILAHVDEEDGRLWAPPGQPKVLDTRRMSIREIEEHLQKTFWDASWGFNDRGLGEAAFYSLNKLMTKHADEAQKLGFLRKDAGLLVLFQSDQEEIGSPIPHPLPHGIAPRCDAYYPPVIKHWYYDREHVNLDSTFAAVRAVKGNMPVSMNAFVNVDRADMEHYIPLPFGHDGNVCVYGSPGFGYFEMVAKTGGLLRSIHEDMERSLDRLGESALGGLGLRHDFPLSHPAAEVDPTSIHSLVDGGLTPHTYSAATDIVHMPYAGKIGSKIDISFCKPENGTGWAISAFAGSTTQTTAALAWQTTGTSTSGKILWGTSANALNQAASDTVTGASHSVTISGLTPNTTYYFQASSTDDFGITKTSSVISLTTQAVPLPAWSITGFAGTATTDTVAVGFDTTQYATTGHVLWGTSPSQLTNATVVDASAETTHTYNVTGLTANTTYYFQATATDDQGQTKTSAVITITTQPNPLPTWSITAFGGTSTQNSVSLSFLTSQLATTGDIVWGTSASSLTNAVPADSSPATSHAYSVTGLAADTTYYFQATATDSAGNTQQSAVIAVTTQPVPLPVWTLTGFAGTATETSVTLTFSTSQYATIGKALWGTSSGNLSNASAPESSAVTAHSVTVSGLSPNTTYYFQASATDDHSQTQTSNVIAITTLPIPPPVWSITDFAGTATDAAATLTFNTSAFATTGQILWGTSPDNLNQSTAADASPVTAHSFTVSGLTASTTYYFQAVATDSTGQTQNSAVISLTTQAPPLPVWSLTGFAGTSTENTVTVTFATAAYATTGVVNWGTASNALTNATSTDASPTTTHSFTITGLQPSTTYYFQAVASDNVGQTQESSVIAVTTQAAGWSIAGFAGTTTATTATLTFNTGGTSTVGQVNWGASSSSLASSTVPDSSGTAHSFTVTGLSPSTTYYFQAQATDSAGLAQTSSVIALTTAAAAPTWSITGFAGTPSETSIALSFATTGTATTGQVNWGTSAGSLSSSTAPDSSPTTAHSYNVTGLSPNTTYFFQAVATDSAGNAQTSAVISVTTAAVGWSITGFAGTTTQTSATLSFSTSAATFGLVNWGSSSSSLSNATPADSVAITSHSFTVTGLSPSTTYFFQAVATDSAGNTQTSAVISVTTAAAPVWTIQGFDGTTTATSAALIWQTGSTPTNAVVRVGLSASDLSLQTVNVTSFASTQTVNITGLAPSTTYFFQVTATDESGDTQTSGVISKTTKASAANRPLRR